MPLSFTDVRDNWDVVKHGLLEICKDHEPDWRLEDVYASLVNGQSHLLMDKARTPKGFVVVESVPIPFRNAQKLLLWLAYDPMPESAVNYAADLEALARKTGHEQIEILTPHKGLWEKASHFGYEFRWATLNKKL